MKSFETVYSPETLRKLQLIELDILKHFDILCKKHNLQYYIIWGTLLGAVRNKGIIPWDDDIDIAMPRKDFEMLKELVPHELGDEYEFLSAEVDPHYPFVTGRVMKRGTEFRMKSMKNVPLNLGIFLDIFPVDNVPDNKTEWLVAQKKAWVLEKLLILRNTPFPNLPYHGIKRMLAYCACGIGAICIKPIPRHVLFAAWKNTVTKYNQSRTQYLTHWGGLKFRLLKRNQVYPLQKMQFEDMQVLAPADAEGLLSMVYGENYMSPPPAGKRSYIVPYRLDLGDGLIEH